MQERERKQPPPPPKKQQQPKQKQTTNPKTLPVRCVVSLISKHTFGDNFPAVGEPIEKDRTSQKRFFQTLPVSQGGFQRRFN